MPLLLYITNKENSPALSSEMDQNSVINFTNSSKIYKEQILVLAIYNKDDGGDIDHQNFEKVNTPREGRGRGGKNSDHLDADTNNESHLQSIPH